MKCQKCGTEFDSKFCPNCGQAAPVQNKFEVNIDWSKSEPTNQIRKRHVSKQPVSPSSSIQYQVEQKGNVTSQKKSKSNLLLSIVFIAIFVFIIVAVSSLGKEDPSDFKDISQKYNVSENLAKSFISSVDKIGLEPKDIEITDVTEENGQTSLNFTHKDYDDTFKAIGDKNKINELRYSTFPLIENSELIGTIQEKSFTSEERIHMIAVVETYIQGILKSPKTAEFANPTEWKLWQDQSTGTIMGNGYVDSENSFGAMIRSNFEFTFERGEDFTLTSLTFDGEKIL